MYILFCFLLSFYTGTQNVNASWSIQFHEKYCFQEPKNNSHNLPHPCRRRLEAAKEATLGSPSQGYCIFSSGLQNWSLSEYKIEKEESM